MPRNRTQNLITVPEKRCKLDTEMAARREAFAKSVGAPFFARRGDNFSSKDAAPLDDLVVLNGPEKPIFSLSR